MTTKKQHRINFMDKSGITGQAEGYAKTNGDFLFSDDINKWIHGKGSTIKRAKAKF